MSCTDNSCGTGGWVGPKPGDPDNNVTLSAVTTFGGVNVSWTYPSTNPWAVAYVQLYRGLSSDFGKAMELAVVQGDRYYDRIENGGVPYYYWMRIISVHGSTGNLIGPAVATPKGRIEDLIEDLTGQIDAGALSQALKAELDKISILNTNLLNEIKSREDGETTLAEALDAVDRGVAEAMTFIHEEINSRTTSESAIIEQINLLAATIDDQFAVVIQTMRVEIDTLSGVTRAMWTAQVNVNGLIGGFGMINDGLTVEAGFDVDRFWVGRTNANKRKPFIIENDITYIDTAMIRQLTFNKLTDDSGTFLVQNGRIQGQYLQVEQANIQNLRVNGAQIDNLRVDKAQINNLIVGAEEIYPNSATVMGAVSATNSVAVPADPFNNARITVPNYNSFGAPVVVTVAVDTVYRQGDGDVQGFWLAGPINIGIYRNGNQLLASQWCAGNVVFKLDIPAGGGDITATFSALGTAEASNAGVGRRTLTLLGCRR